MRWIRWIRPDDRLHEFSVLDGALRCVETKQTESYFEAALEFTFLCSSGRSSLEEEEFVLEFRCQKWRL